MFQGPRLLATGPAITQQQVTNEASYYSLELAIGQLMNHARSVLFYTLILSTFSATGVSTLRAAIHNVISSCAC